ncbi:MAG: methylenetetrahydrofolate--tRNA-(uracil(54)-C(5))-methyltransferase (FADH(2)-oxidizing) TrmFO [Chloroflexi bacterium]|nr:methylenetetrahydrofolate--tRNA-(uracil(54)-C(5))-methyltransferase (FADH(2)-oxidizing) TrmFO [Chloroflexota bacterium]
MRNLPSQITIIGAGLAGAEAAWQAGQRGLHVTLYEMRPAAMTPAHQTGDMAELVCSNSLGSNLPDRALGLLKNELRRLGSLIVACADRTAVPAGSALAVGRQAFSRAVTEAIERHPNITVRREEVTDLPPFLPGRGEETPPSLPLQGREELALSLSKGGWGDDRGRGPITVVATGPLTSSALAESIRRLAGQDSLSFFDAMAPIVTAESINMEVAFRASRWGGVRGQGSGVGDQRAGIRGQESGISAPPDSCLLSPDFCLLPPASSGDYINCPLTRDEYYAFVAAVNAAEKISLREFEGGEAARRYFEACLPIEVLAGRDLDALAFGPMTPIGLRDPRTGRRPFAVAQLRQDNVAGTLYNLVGFQTSIKWGDQERVLRMIPGLERAEFVRFGQMHRNTFIASPALLRPTLQWHDRDDLFFAGQITGTEGYVGSTAGGLLAGLNAARVAQNLPPVTLPPTTMMGALFHYITHAPAVEFQPMKANFGLMPELDPPVRDKRKRHAAYADRALADLAAALASQGV